MIVLEIGSITVVVGTIILIIYEAVALITGRVKRITDIVRPWVAQHKLLSTFIAGGWVGLTAFFILHFFT